MNNIFSLNETTPLNQSEEWHELQRLFLLENAVVNYGGGIMTLEKRVHKQAEKLRQNEPDAAQLLDDIALYLHDIVLTGKLNTEGQGSDRG